MYVLATDKREYNRIMQQIRRQREKEIIKLYQDSSVSGISFHEFKKQFNLTKWQKLSIALSDGELKLDKISHKLSDGQLRIKKRAAKT
jgi:predicted ATPase